MFPTLRKGDGYPNVSLNKKDAVEKLQSLLKELNFRTGVDGFFGSKTEKLVIKFQTKFKLTADGVVGPATWKKLAQLTQSSKLHHVEHDFLKSFNGDLGWVHEREGHAGNPYWPGGQSGVTLDPGFDLGYQTKATLNQYYSKLTRKDLDSLESVVGKKGKDAKKAARQVKIKGIRISNKLAFSVMPAIADRYWNAIVKKFPELVSIPAPPSVQTVFLSLAYNRGAANKKLKVLTEPLKEGRWLKIADLVASMQQDHALRGIRIRRRMEAQFIRDEMDFS